MRDNVLGGALTETTFLILLSLYEPSHGYKIMQFIEEKTNQRVHLGAGTLYGAIHTLEEKGWILPLQEVERKKMYQISPLGKRICEQEYQRLKELMELSQSVMKGVDTI